MNRLTPESALKKAVTDLLDAEHIWWMRTNAGVITGETNGKRWAVHMARKGLADIMALPKVPARCPRCRCAHGCNCEDGKITRWESIVRVPMPLWIETKVRPGKQSQAQRDFQAEVEAQGHTYLLVYDVQQVIEWIRRNR